MNNLQWDEVVLHVDEFRLCRVLLVHTPVTVKLIQAISEPFRSSIVTHEDDSLSPILFARGIREVWGALRRSYHHGILNRLFFLFKFRQDCSHSLRKQKLVSSTQITEQDKARQAVQALLIKHDLTFRQTDQKAPHFILFASLLTLFSRAFALKFSPPSTRKKHMHLSSQLISTASCHLAPPQKLLHSHIYANSVC